MGDLGFRSSIWLAVVTPASPRAPSSSVLAAAALDFQVSVSWFCNFGPEHQSFLASDCRGGSGLCRQGFCPVLKARVGAGRRPRASVGSQRIKRHAGGLGFGQRVVPRLIPLGGNGRNEDDFRPWMQACIQGAGGRFIVVALRGKASVAAGAWPGSKQNTSPLPGTCAPPAVLQVYQ